VELVEIVRGDRQELDALEQGMRLVARLRDNTRVEREPAQLTIEIERGMAEIGLLARPRIDEAAARTVLGLCPLLSRIRTFPVLARPNDMPVSTASWRRRDRPASAARGPARARRTSGGLRSRPLRPAARSRAGLPREGGSRRGAMRFALQRPRHRACPPTRWFSPARRGPSVLGRLPARPFARLSFAGRRQCDPGAPGLRQADRDRLLRGSGAVLSVPYVLDFLAHELPGLCGRSLSAAAILPGARDRAFVGHRLLQM
jgi:hypothetical protein